MKLQHSRRAFALMLVILSVAVAVAMVTAGMNRLIHMGSYQKHLEVRQDQRQVLRSAVLAMRHASGVLLDVPHERSARVTLEVAGTTVDVEITPGGFITLDGPNTAQRRLTLVSRTELQEGSRAFLARRYLALLEPGEPVVLIFLGEFVHQGSATP